MTRPEWLFGFSILQVERVPESFESDIVGVFQIFHRLAQHFGAGANHFFKALVIVLGFFKRLAMTEGALNGVQQLLALKRLEEIVVGSAAHGVNGDADVVNCGDPLMGRLG